MELSAGVERHLIWIARIPLTTAAECRVDILVAGVIEGYMLDGFDYDAVLPQIVSACLSVAPIEDAPRPAGSTGDPSVRETDGISNIIPLPFCSAEARVIS